MPHGFQTLSEEPESSIQIGDNHVLNRGQVLAVVLQF